MPDASPLPSPSLAERFRGRAARALDRAARRGPRRAGGGAPREIDGQTLDPALQAVLALNPRGDPGRMSRDDAARARADLRRDVLALTSPPTRVGGVRDLTWRAPRARSTPGSTRRHGGGPPPLVVYFHGGGFSRATSTPHDEPCRLLCREAGHAVLSVAYRLAPEHPFPAAYDDAARRLPLGAARAPPASAPTRTRVAVGGDSAGGNLAAGVARRPPATTAARRPAPDLPGHRPPDAHPSRRLFDGFFLPDPIRRASTTSTRPAPSTPATTPASRRSTARSTGWRRRSC